MTEQHPPRVFISYSHDTIAHQERVLGLADRLRADGIDAEIDQYEPAPREGWPIWCEQQIKKSDYVLLICTATYLQRVNGEELPGFGHGVLWEARIIRQLLYDSGSVSAKFIPVLFSDGSVDNTPTSVRGATQHVVDSDTGYEGLYRQLTQQPDVIRPPLGNRKPLPPKRPKSQAAAAARSAEQTRNRSPLFEDQIPKNSRTRRIMSWWPSYVTLLVAISAVGLGYSVYVYEWRDAYSSIRPSNKQLDGSYTVDGSTPSGTHYDGEAEITYDYDIYTINWKLRTLEPNRQRGNGRLLDGALIVISDNGGTYTYSIEQDGTLKGKWADGAGAETLKRDLNN